MKVIMYSFKKALCLFVIFFQLCSATSAQSTSKIATSQNMVTYVASDNELLIFDVHANIVSSKAILRIYNEEGVVLFEEKLAIGNYNKRYKVIPEGMKQVQFEIYTRRETLRQSFDLQKQVIEHFVVTAHK
jgi:hypothetical protein